MTVKLERKLDEKISSITCSPDLKLYAVITVNGRLLIFRYQNTLIWNNGGANEKYYRMCWHPESNYIILFFKRSKIDYFSIICTQKFSILFEDTCEFVLSSRWTSIDILHMQKEENELFNELNIGSSQTLLNEEIPEIFTELNKKLNITLLNHESGTSIYFQGFLQILKLPFNHIGINIDSNLNIILLTKEYKFCILDIISKIARTINIMSLTNTLFTLRLEVNSIAEDINTIPGEVIDKLLPFFNIFPQNKLVETQKSLLLCYFYGKVNRQLSSIIAIEPNEAILTSAASQIEKLQDIWSQFTNFTIKLEKVISSVISLQSLLTCHSKLQDSPEIISFINKLSSLHKKCLTFIKFQSDRKYINNLRIFVSWITLVRNFSIRSSQIQSVFLTDPFHKIHDLGSHSIIYKFLINFLLDDFIQVFKDPSSMFSFSLDPEDSLQKYFSPILDSIVSYFNSLSIRHFYDLNFTIESLTDCCTSFYGEYLYFAASEKPLKPIKYLSIKNTPELKILSGFVTCNPSFECLYFGIFRDELVCLSKMNGKKDYIIEIFQYSLEKEEFILVNSYDFDSLSDVLGFTYLKSESLFLYWTERNSIFTLNLDQLM